ncbi:LytR/AlgR family response regulator transcription factor [Roseivirga pacifica]|uniref:LytR/AlgR family response regulator transcription factor n=1 Tax=Roseivirga pacifica TaxID=1267423 RepID=UPI003BAA8863
MSSVKVLIVEDESLIARDLRTRLMQFGYEVQDICNTFEEAKQTIEESKDYDLVLVDIELNGEMKGLEIAKLLQELGKVPFIFLTSHTSPEIVNKAQYTGPSAYLVKPFRDREIQIAIDLAIANFEKAHVPVSTQNVADTYQLDDTFFLKKKYRYDKVPVTDILFAEAQRNYTLIKTKAESYLLSQTLKTVKERLNYPFFIQTHRSYLINIAHIAGFEGNCVFIDDQEIPVSKNYRNSVFNKFRTL